MSEPTAAEQPLVSVIVPAYNHEQFITETLDSARLEGYPNLEIVLIDDGSTDRTWERVQSWEADHGREARIVSRRQENVGLTRTLNRLLVAARGKYVATVASDDRLLPGGIGPRVEYLESHPDISAVFSDCRVIDVNGRVTSEHGIGFGEPKARERLLKDPAREIVEHWGVPGPVLLCDRKLIRAIGGYSEDLMVEDWDLYLRLAARNAIAYVDVPVSEYRWHGANTAARPEHAVRVANELRGVAWRSRRLFRGHLYLELVHETASWAARAAWLERRRPSWIIWKIASLAAKLVAMAIPRRSSDQVLARPS